MSDSGTMVPDRYQPPLPIDRLLLPDAPDPEALPMDVVIVGGGPAGLATAIELMRLARADGERGGKLGGIQVAVLEKAAGIGEHNLSGAVVNPRALRELFPDLDEADLPLRGKVSRERLYFLTETRAQRLPTPPTMRNHGFHVASIGEICRWLAEKAEAAGVNVLPGFPVASMLMDGDRAVGVRTVPAGLDRTGDPGPRYEAGTDVVARAVVLAEGTRGSLTQAFLQTTSIRSANPQIYALGVKEIWETRSPLDTIVHTLGWPLPPTVFGGSFMYPLEPNLVAVGLVVGLDYPSHALDVHGLLQQMKMHPLFQRTLRGGEMVEWGAKTIPEGGYHSLPARFSGNGVVVVGDAAGLVDVPSLKGIHYAIQSGIFAARAIFAALAKDDTGADQLAEYDRMLAGSYVVQDLYRSRNVRLAFKQGLVPGMVKAGVMTVSGGRLIGRRIETEPDVEVPRTLIPAESLVADGKATFSKVDAVFKSGNRTRDDIPSHLIVGSDIPREVAEMYSHMCPAGVYDLDGDRLVVNAPNCIDCKATDILGPRWLPREGGSGPAYKRM